MAGVFQQTKCPTSPPPRGEGLASGGFRHLLPSLKQGYKPPPLPIPTRGRGIRRHHLVFLAVALLLATPAAAAGLTIEITGNPSIVFDSSRDGCTPDDTPDVNPRAYRDASNQVVMFALHDVNRPMRGPDLGHLKIDCHIALGSPEDPDPAHYAERNFITATWTDDGINVGALVHHEYHADQFGRCHASGDLGCWYNTILGYHSSDGGRDFVKSKPLVVAAAPFRQEVEQGRQRGFFNPSNIVADRGFYYAMISTTGWDGQSDGNCLFRTSDPRRPGSWRAYDGHAFTVRYEDPYAVKTPQAKPCQTIAPFVFPVGSIVRHKATGTWIALFQASAGAAFPLDGFYYATSRDLLHWGAPKILLAGRTLYGDLCTAGPSIINYPALLDPASTRRNFDDVGDHPDLFFAHMDVAKCQTGQRLLVREEVTIRADAKP